MKYPIDGIMTNKIKMIGPLFLNGDLK